MSGWVSIGALLTAVLVATNCLTWLSLSREMPGRRPWNWRVITGPFLYYPWLDRVHPSIDTRR